jgi:hypothetical protein
VLDFREVMADEGEPERQRILDRANRMLKQSQTLRRLADELLEESQDLQESVRKQREKQSLQRKRR